MCENKLTAISNLELIEIPVKPSQLIYNIPDQPFLRGKKITNIQLIPSDMVQVSPSGAMVLDGGDIPNIYFNFWDGNKLRVRNMPAANLTNLPSAINGTPTNNIASVYSNQSFNAIEITWNKSQIIFVMAPSQQMSILLQVWYLD